MSLRSGCDDVAEIVNDILFKSIYVINNNLSELNLTCQNVADIVYNTFLEECSSSDEVKEIMFHVACEAIPYTNKKIYSLIVRAENYPQCIDMNVEIENAVRTAGKNYNLNFIFRESSETVRRYVDN